MFKSVPRKLLKLLLYQICSHFEFASVKFGILETLKLKKYCNNSNIWISVEFQPLSIFHLYLEMLSNENFKITGSGHFVSHIQNSGH